jgi:hypothetical protein
MHPPFAHLRGHAIFTFGKMVTNMLIRTTRDLAVTEDQMLDLISVVLESVATVEARLKGFMRN